MNTEQTREQARTLAHYALSLADSVDADQSALARAELILTRAQQLVSALTPPPLDVVIDGESLVCPHCETRDEIREEDRSERWNRVDFDGERISIAQGSCADFETTGWSCYVCGKPVEMPLELVQSAEWY